MKYFKIIGALCLLNTIGCVSISDRLDKAESALMKKEATSNELGCVSIHDWNHVIELVKKSPKLRDIEVRLHYARLERKRIVHDLLPSVSVASALNKSVTELGQIGVDDFIVYANGIVRLPNPFDLRAKYLKVVLTEYSSELEYALAYRESLSQAYEMIVSAKDVERSISEVQRIKDKAQTESSHYEIDDELLRLAGEKLKIDGMLSTVFGTSAKWMVQAVELPEIKIGQETILSGGKLLRKVTAARIVALDLADMGLLLDMLPRINSSLSIPSLFRVQDGDYYSSWDMDDVRLNLSAYYDLDINGRKKFNRERLGELNAIQRERVESDYLGQRNDALRAVELLENAQAKLETMERLDDRIAPEFSQKIREQLIQQQDQLLQAQLSVLVWDDKFFGDTI